MKFTDSHEWIEVKEGLGTVGISQHAQKELGEIVYVELPEEGKMVQAGKEAAVLESTKAAADVYSPVSGTIESVNRNLQASPDLINTSPENEGWIYTIRISDETELDALMSKEDYLSKLP
ncbi:MAG: glycine cleavage system protein GcvH [Parachlamydiaceae bacterium]